MEPIQLLLSVHFDGTISLWDNRVRRQHGTNGCEVFVDLTLTPEQDAEIRSAYRVRWPTYDLDKEA